MMRTHFGHMRPIYTVSKRTSSACSIWTAAHVARRMYTDARTIRTPHPYDQVIRAENEEYVENLMKQYSTDSALVNRSWAPVLEMLKSGNVDTPVVSTFSRPVDSQSLSQMQRLDNMRLSWMITQYERHGHFLANIFPVRDETGVRPTPEVNLDINAFGFTEEDYSKVFNVSFGASYESTFVSGGTAMTLQQIVEQLQKMYCGYIGFEFMNSGFFDLRNWFRQEILNALNPLPLKLKRDILDDVVTACGFEQFLQRKYATVHRFGLDGGEAFIAAMNAAIAEASNLGVESCILGMAHRGRLNVLANVCRKSLNAILNEFEGRVPVSDVMISGDVKYHLGWHGNVPLRNGRKVEMHLLSNPAHLEAVNPLVLGRTRAREVYSKDLECNTTLPILVHGDASFSGQGICFEVMGFSNLENFYVGGTLHIVINNQVGFTTNPKLTQAGVYCTALSKINDAPVLHVNGDNVEACVHAALIAARFRQHFHRDVILDIVCYRRHGHNEADLPDFTQPVLYNQIRHHPVLVDIYKAQLVSENVVTEDEVQNKIKAWDNVIRQSFDRLNSSQDFVQVTTVFDPESENTSEDLSLQKQQLMRVQPPPPIIESGVDMALLKSVGLHITSIPAEVVKAHPVVERTYAARKKGIENGDAIEWCLAELLALGTLSLEGIPIRLSGEDVERGTFTQRHASVIDTKTNLKYFPVATLSKTQAPITIANSSLSECGVCGFELGYNMENTKSLVMWEAQFGDFANGAQVVIDQFLCCSEDKWNEPNSLVLSLPHGYSGAGPEHSSARIERYLQLSNDIDRVPRNFREMSPEQMLEFRIRKRNMQITYPSTPANYYHLLRRQALRDFAKPLINFFSKARLRAPNLSKLSELATGTVFQPVIDFGVAENTVPRKVLFCAGQIESIVSDARRAAQTHTKDANAHNDIVLVTVEQLAPFPWEQIADTIEKYMAMNKEIEFVWLQEEPQNMGMWSFVRPRMNSLMTHLGTSQRIIHYIGRPSAASPATGYGSVHVEEEQQIVRECFA